MTSSPPSFRLHTVGEPAGSVLERDTTDETAEAVGPIRIGQKQAQHGPAEELAACSDLRRNGEFAQPAIELPVPVLCSDKAFRVVEPALEGQ